MENTQAQIKKARKDLQKFSGQMIKLLRDIPNLQIATFGDVLHINLGDSVKNNQVKCLTPAYPIRMEQLIREHNSLIKVFKEDVQKRSKNVIDCLQDRCKGMIAVNEFEMDVPQHIENSVACVDEYLAFRALDKSTTQDDNCLLQSLNSFNSLLQQSIEDLSAPASELKQLNQIFTTIDTDKYKIFKKTQGRDIGFNVAARRKDPPYNWQNIAFVKLYLSDNLTSAYEQLIMHRLFGDNGIQSSNIEKLTDNVVALVSRKVPSVYDDEKDILHDKHFSSYVQLFNIMVKSMIIDAKDIRASNIVGNQVIDALSIFDSRYHEYIDPSQCPDPSKTLLEALQYISQHDSQYNTLYEQMQKLGDKPSLVSNMIQRFILSQIKTYTNADGITSFRMQKLSTDMKNIDLVEMCNTLSHTAMNTPEYITLVCNDIAKNMQQMFLDPVENVTINVPLEILHKFDTNVKDKSLKMLKLAQSIAQPDYRHRIVYSPSLTHNNITKPLIRVDLSAPELISCADNPQPILQSLAQSIAVLDRTLASTVE